MEEIAFKAKVITATKSSKDNYYMVGLTDDEYNYDKYILFQRPIKLGKDDDPEADSNGLYAECNGDVCYNGCRAATLTSQSFRFEFDDSIIVVDVTDVKIGKRFIAYSREIFKELLKLPDNSIL